MRKLIVLFSLVAAVMVSATAADAAGTTISATLSRTSTTVGTTVYVQGRVTPAGATSRVVLQRAVDKRWADRGAASVDPATGAYKVAVKPSQAGTYKLRVRSNGGSVASATIYLKVTSPPTTIGASLSASSVRVRSTTYVVGKVSKPTATPRVVVQRSVGGRWVDLASGGVDQRKGEFSVPLVPSQVGSYVLRVRSSGGSVVSRNFTLQVTGAPAPGPRCDPNYTGCVPIASDVDCAGGSGDGPAYVQGPIRVVGSDIYGLDHDRDGIACES